MKKLFIIIGAFLLIAGCQLSFKNSNKDLTINNDFEQTLGAATTTVSSTGYSTWTVPNGITSVNIACWGGGGAGFTGTTAGGGAGGGGGAFASSTVSVSGGQVIRFFIGAGGATSGANGATTTA